MRDLNAVMEIDHVIQVHADGTVTEPRDVWAPELFAISDADGQHTAQTDPDLREQAKRQGWDLETGWTGQCGYNGPCMHPSEYVGGRLAEHILATPGLWAAIAVSEEDGSEAFWALVHRAA